MLGSIRPEERGIRLRQWQIANDRDTRLNDLLAKFSGFPRDLKTKSLGEVVNLVEAAKLIVAENQCEMYSAPIPLYCQSAIPCCAASVGRMLAAYYGVYHPEAQVAKIMGIVKKKNQNSIKQPTVAGELKYYRSPKGLNKAGSETHRRMSYFNDWKNFKKVLQVWGPSSLGFGTGSEPFH